MPEAPFKTCKVCDHLWPTRDSFVADDEIRLIGYQANIMAVEKGLFLFNHSCDGTLSINAMEFADLYDGPVYAEHKTGNSECPGYCLYVNDLRPCPAKCDCAFVRNILQLLKKSEPVTD